MKTTNRIIEAFIKYLEERLTKDRDDKFKKVAPRTFYYKDEVDTIIVYVTDKNLVIINDGSNVIDGIEMTPLLLSEKDDQIFNSYLQNILHKF